MHESSIGWIGYSSEATRRLAADLEPERDGVVDEMGVLVIHSGYADRFFPGTSVLQKHPRYLFFTCWNYLSLERAPSGDTRLQRKESAEQWVKEQLLQAGVRNRIIGATVEKPAQPVDYIYWSCLRLWGFYRGPDRSSLLVRRDSLPIERVTGIDYVEEKVTSEAPARFLAPEPPRYWLRPRPRTPLTFDLPRSEAQFLNIRLQSLEPCLLNKAASFAAKLRPTRATPWDEPVLARAAADLEQDEMLERARLASSLALLVRAVYGALVERRRNEADGIPRDQHSTHYRDTLAERVLGEAPDLKLAIALDLSALDTDLPELARPTRTAQSLKRILVHVQERLGHIKTAADIRRRLLDDETLDLLAKHEGLRKGGRARLPDTEPARERRMAFDKKTISVYALDYRWNVARTVLQDLHAGLLRAEES